MKNMKIKTVNMPKCCIYSVVYTECCIYRDTKLFLQLEMLCRGNIESKKALQAD